MLGMLESILVGPCRLDKDRPVLVGVSGGADSLCLLSALHEWGWQVIVGQFNHMLREEAEEEAAAVEALAARLDIPFAGGRGDVRQYAADNKLSIETAARELRYRFLFEQARERGAQAVAVGHTADDQVETVLMHFLRGAGLNGLKGMPYRTILPEYDPTIPLVRPLLDAWRPETVAYCQSHGLHIHYDLSNESMDFLRNRVRHELIPVLETYNPRFREALWRSGKTLAADHELLGGVLEPIWQKALARRSAGYLAFNERYLSEQPAAVQIHLFMRASQRLVPGYETGYADLQRAVDFLADEAQDRTDFAGGLFLFREQDLLFVTAAEAALPYDQWPQMPAGAEAICFSAPSETMLAQGWRFRCEQCSAADLGSQPWKRSSAFEAYLDADALPDELELRARREGDRFEPLGMGGHSQKLSDFFINEKLPARARDRWPLVCSGDQVVWVPGYRPAHPYRMRTDSVNAICLAVTAPDAT